MLHYELRRNDVKEYDDSEFCLIEEAHIYVCLNCGAYGSEIRDIRHYKTCNPGDAEKWKKYSERNNLQSRRQQLEMETA